MIARCETGTLRARTAWRWGWRCGVLLALGLSGCTRPLLSPGEERSPYDRYDTVRDKRAPQFVEDKYGRRKPDLTGRLAPKS